MLTRLQQCRQISNVSLRELARVLGPGFSAARLSLAERGLIELPNGQELLILEVIGRLAPLCQNRRRILEAAREIDFAPLFADVRESDFTSARA
jgi:hypothetical protein